MDIGDILGPWILLMMLVIPLLYVEKFIHQHIYGIGYLITKDKEQATTFYYLIFFPGVFLHEFIQYFVAGILNVPVKKLEPRPQKQDNGTLRFDFVTIQKTDKWRAAIIGGTPFIIACVIMWTISTSILDLHLIPEAFATGEIIEVANTFNNLRNTPDFWLWMYLLFTISNGMIPTKEDREGWSFILVAIVAVSAFFLFLGLDNVIVETYQGPVMHGLAMVNTALAILLFVDIFAVLMLGVVEDTLERIRGEKMDYSGPKLKQIKRQAGSDLPIPAGEPMPSVYNLALPVPSLPPMGRIVRPSTVDAKPASQEETKSVGVPTPPARQPASTPEEKKSEPSRQPAPALASREPTLERAPDPDAAMRAQMDPRMPRTSGDSPFKRTSLPQDEAKSVTPSSSGTPRRDISQAESPPRRSASPRPETKSEPTREPAVPSSGGGRRFIPSSDSSSNKDAAEATQSMSTTQRIPPEVKDDGKANASSEAKSSSRFGRRPDADDKKTEERSAASSRFQRKSADDKSDAKSDSKPSSRFGRRPDADDKKTEERSAATSRFQRKPVDDKSDAKSDSKPSSRFGRRPDTDDKKTEERSAASSRFQRKSADDKSDAKSDSKPSSRFGRRPDTDDKKTEERSAASSRFQRKPTDDKKSDAKSDSKPSSRFGRRPDADDKKTEERSAASSRFQRKPTDDKKSDETEVKPAKPTGRFGRASASAAEPTQTMQTTGRFQPAQPPDESKEEENIEDLTPAKPSGRFSRPRRERNRPDTPPSNRFGRRSQAVEEDLSSDNDDSEADNDVEYVDFDDI